MPLYIADAGEVDVYVRHLIDEEVNEVINLIRRSNVVLEEINDEVEGSLNRVEY